MLLQLLYIEHISVERVRVYLSKYLGKLLRVLHIVAEVTFT